MLAKCSSTELSSPLVVFTIFDGCLYFTLSFALLELDDREEEKRCGTEEEWDFFVLGS